MTIQEQDQSDNKKIQFEIIGPFDVGRAMELKGITKHMTEGLFVLDFEQCTNLDSSGLGLLLNLRKSLPKLVTIRLANCPLPIKRVLSITRFERFFEID